MTLKKNDLKLDYLNHFTPESLIRSMVPINTVIDQYIAQYEQNIKTLGVKKSPSQEHKDATTEILSWTTIKSQENFAKIILSIIVGTNDVGIDNNHKNHHIPSHRYLKKLLLRFVSRLEREALVEDETLSELLCSKLTTTLTSPTTTTSTISKSTSTNETETTHDNNFSSFHYNGYQIFDDSIPNPMESCHVSFYIPTNSTSKAHATTSKTSDEYNHTNKNIHHHRYHPYDTILHIRIFPHHNDVGIRKVWEAGCCLAEFFFTYPNYVKNQHVLELGAGVGLTGLIISACCGARSVHMTDYTEGTLENLKHNTEINHEFLKHQGVDLKSISSGYLEWNSYGNIAGVNKEESKSSMISDISQNTFTDSTTCNGNHQHNVLIAADVVYDQNYIPDLVKTLKTFLTKNRENIAIFATTYRNEKTFQEFMSEIERYGMQTETIQTDTIDNLIYIFPCYIDQPRSDVRICIFRL